MQHTRKEVALWSIALTVVLLYCLIPIIWIVSLSLKRPEDIADQNFIPRHISFENYDNVFSEGTFTAALRNSIGIAIIATLISIVLAAMAAYAITRLEFTGKALILTGAL